MGNFSLNNDQKKLCHELTMEFLRQNNALQLQKGEDGKYKRGYEQVSRSYFLVYEEMAIGIHRHWDKIQGELYCD